MTDTMVFILLYTASYALLVLLMGYCIYKEIKKIKLRNLKRSKYLKLKKSFKIIKGERD